MKKLIKRWIVWGIVGLQLCLFTGVACAAEQQPAPKKLTIMEKITSLISRHKKTKDLPSVKKKSLRDFVRELVPIMREKLRRKREKSGPAQSVEDLQAQYDLDVRQLKIESAIKGVGVSLALVISLVGLAIFNPEEPLYDSFEGFMASLYGLFGSMAGGGYVLAKAVDKFDKLPNKYRLRALSELIPPRERERIKLLQEIRTANQRGDVKNSAALMKRLSKLDGELLEIDNKFRVNRWTLEVYDLLINLILEQANKKIAKTDSVYKVFREALAQNKRGLEKLLEAGNIHLFDEAWVWPVVAQMYQFHDTRPLKELVEFTQAIVNWKKWYSYWTEMERRARKHGLIGSKETFERLNAEKRKELVDTIKEKEFRRSLGAIAK